MRGFALVLAVSMVVPTTHLSSQQTPIQPGQRVRVTHDCRSRYVFGRSRTTCQTDDGILATLTGDSIVLNVGDADTMVSIPLASTTKLQVPRMHRSYVLRGAIIGGLVGAAVGGGLGYWWGNWDRTPYDVYPRDYGFAVTWGLAGGAVLGGLGALIGKAASGSPWEEVPLDRLRVSFAPQRDGTFALGLSVAF